MGRVRCGFRELVVWRRGKALAVEIYPWTVARDFGLRDQIRRAAVSVPSNIAEGEEREGNKESIRFFYIAKASLAELATQLEIAGEIGYMEQAQMQELVNECEQIARMLGSLIKTRNPEAAFPRTSHPEPRT